MAASHGGVYAAYLAAVSKVRGVILNDAGLGLDRAGIGGLDLAQKLLICYNSLKEIVALWESYLGCP